jgi:hypothetical protein
MRIGIDATPLLLRSAGIKTWAWHWIEHLRAAAPASGDTVSAFPFIGEAGRLDHERSVLSTAATLPRIALLLALNGPGNPLLNALVRGFDVFHMSNQIRRLPRGPRITATIHDMTCWLMP